MRATRHTPQLLWLQVWLHATAVATAVECGVKSGSTPQQLCNQSKSLGRKKKKRNKAHHLSPVLHAMLAPTRHLYARPG